MIRLLILFAVLQTAVAFLTNSLSFTHEEAMWHYIGRNWFQYGLAPYAGGVDNKSPLIFAVFGLSDMLFGLQYWFPRLAGIACQTAGIYYLYRIALRLYSREAAVIGATMYGLALTWHVTGGKYVSFTEVYAVTFLLMAVNHYVNNEKRSDLVCGLLAGIAIGWRLSAIFGAAAILAHALSKRRASVAALCVGMLSGLLLVILMLMAAGIHAHELYTHALADNFGAGSTTDHDVQWKAGAFAGRFLLSELVWFYPALAAYFFLPKQYSLLTIWLALEFIGVNLLGIYAYAHFKQLLPPLAIAAGIGLVQLSQRQGWRLAHVLIAIWILFFPKSTEPLQAIKKMITPTPDQSAALCAAPHARTDDLSEEKLGTWIREHTRPQDKVLVAGYGARVQLFSQRLSPTVYFNVTQTARAKARFLREVAANKPQLMAIPIFPDYAKYVDADLRQFISRLAQNGYTRDKCLYGYEIYRRLPIVD